MASINKSVLVEFSANQIYSLVNDVEEYPKFLPWCSNVNVSKKDPDVLVAEIVMNFLGIKESFTTKNVNTPPTKIVMNLVKGPFNYLNGNWNFTPITHNACKIEFSINYEFSNKILEKAIGPLFSRMISNFVDSFCNRAKIVYG